FVQTTNETLFETLSTDGANISAGLVKGASLNLLAKSAAPPAGCAVIQVSSDCNVYLLVKGTVDFDAEIVKLNASKAKAVAALVELQKKLNAPDYKTKVKAEVQEANLAKKTTLETEVSTLDGAIKNFESLKNE
ncbi:hypothetical protein HK100_010507, partial [Physocladia obscura]